MKEQCCERDNDRDGNCDVHASRGVTRSEAIANRVLLTSTEKDLEIAALLSEECRIYERSFGKAHPDAVERVKDLRRAAVRYTGMLAISLGGFDGCRGSAILTLTEDV